MTRKYKIDDPAKVRGVVVIIDCPNCEGSGMTYASMRASMKSTCENCDGDGYVDAHLSLAAFHRLLDATRNKP